MDENKRFKVIDKQFISYYGGNGHLISNENCKFWLWHDESGSQKVCDKLNIIIEENEQLKETIKELELENAKHIGDGEWDIRDITYGHGKFRLEEWGERYHQFYNGDKQLEDEEVVSLLFENEQLKQQVEDLYESDKSLRKFASNMTLNYTGICVPRRLFDEVLNILKDMEHNDLVEDLSKESIDTSANGY